MASQPGKATRKPRADSLRNRERLIATAAEAFRAGGAEASFESIAKRAGVGIGTLYRHFPTRQALFEAVYRREVDQLAELAKALTEADPPVRALRLWLHAGVSMVATKKGMLAALAIAVDGTSELQAYSYAHLTQAAGTLLERAVAANEIRGDVGPEDLLQALIGMCMMGKQPGWEENVIRLIDVFVDGLCIRPPSG